jgi:LacI family transcriptional regulator
VLNDHGINIPADIAVVGFNNDDISKLVQPRLTTINYPGKDLGEIAARSLIDQLNNKTTVQLANRIIIRSDLIIRQSSLKKIT